MCGLVLSYPRTPARQAHLLDVRLAHPELVALEVRQEPVVGQRAARAQLCLQPLGHRGQKCLLRAVLQLIVVVVVVNKRILRILPFRIRALLGAIRRTRIVARRVGLFLVAAVCSRPHLWDDRVGLQIWRTWRSWWS